MGILGQRSCLASSQNVVCAGGEGGTPHVTRSFCHRPPAFPFGWLKESPFCFNFSPTRHSQFKFQRNFDDESRGLTAISPLRVDPTTHASSPPDTHRSSLIEKRYALLPISCADCGPKHTMEWPSQLPIVLPARRPLTGAPLTVSTGCTEHNRDSQRSTHDTRTFSLSVK